MLVPDYQDPETIRTFGIISRMAYRDGEYDMGDRWKFRWKFGKDNKKEHKVGGIIFLGSKNYYGHQLAIISYKGTSTLLSDIYKYNKYKYDKDEVCAIRRI